MSFRLGSRFPLGTIRAIIRRGLEASRPPQPIRTEGARKASGATRPRTDRPQAIAGGPFPRVADKQALTHWLVLQRSGRLTRSGLERSLCLTRPESAAAIKILGWLDKQIVEGTVLCHYDVPSDIADPIWSLVGRQSGNSVFGQVVRKESKSIGVNRKFKVVISLRLAPLFLESAAEIEQFENELDRGAHDID